MPSLFPFLLLNLLACDSAKWLILLQTEARTINSLSKLTKAVHVHGIMATNLKPTPLNEIIIHYLF